MERFTIDFGIDLGTTNSEIAVLKGNGTEIFKNNLNQEYTPSAVYKDKNGHCQIGQQAKNRTGDKKYWRDAKIEFKRAMGTDQEYHFPSSNNSMSPEQLSAEILKSLKGDVQQYGGEEISSAVISVPAIFDLPQNKATMEAAKIAGIENTALIQEPIAAAMAYSFQREDDRVFWLVFDLGGGTFDAAIINCRDSQIRVINHGGDRFLGGKDIDWAIVEKILAPAIQREYKLENFVRSNEYWAPLFNKLKLNAEDSKIRLSRSDSDKMVAIDWIDDNSGKKIYFEYDLKRIEIEPYIEETVLKAVNICKKTIEEGHLSSNDIEKVILVGGPTLSPLVRDIIKQELKIPLDYSIDPITVVARGAAVFAGTQIVERSINERTMVLGQYNIELDFEPVGTELTPPIGGKVVPLEGESLEGFTIEFMENNIPWRSGKISLNNVGSFITELKAEKDRENVYYIELLDRTGLIYKTKPNRFSYRYGLTVKEQILQISTGVALANGEMHSIISKGTTLPARKRDIFRSTKVIQKGESASFLVIPFLQGENLARADRNLNIGNITIDGLKIKRDIPVGSEVEVTLEMDSSQQVYATAYVPLLDDYFEVTIDLNKKEQGKNKLQEIFNSEKHRIKEVKEKRQALQISKGEQYLVDQQLTQIMEDIEANIDVSDSIDAGAPLKCEEALLKLQILVDEMEAEIEWPTLVTKTENNLEEHGEFITQYGKDKDQARFRVIEVDIRKAIDSHDSRLLNLKLDELRDLIFPIYLEQPGFWVGYFEYLIERSELISDKFLADTLITQGRKAIDNNDLEGLKSAVRQLIDLLPETEKEEAKGFGSTIMKFNL